MFIHISLSSQFNTTSALSTPTSLTNSGLGGTLCQSAIQKPPLSASRVRLQVFQTPLSMDLNEAVIQVENYCFDIGLYCRVLA